MIRENYSLKKTEPQNSLSGDESCNDNEKPVDVMK